MRKRIINKRPLRKRVARRPRRVVKKSTVSMAVKRYVKRTIHKNVENKCQQVAAGGDFGNVNASSVMNVFPCTPYTGYLTIGTGVTQNSRIGNQVKPVKVMLNYIIRPTVYDATKNPNPAPCEIDLYLGYVKPTPSILPTASDFLNLYQLGATSTPAVGNLSDLVATLNLDYWHISKRWRHKVGYSNNNYTGNQPNYESFTNNDFKLNVIRKMDITRYYPKTLTFNDSAQPTTAKGLFFFYQAVNAGGVTNTAAILPMNIQFWIEVKYEDA